MNTSDLVREVEKIIIDLENVDNSSKDYSSMVNNASKLHQMLGSNEELELKKKRNEFDEQIRKDQLEFEKAKFELEKNKFNLDVTRANNQHEEKMAEIKVNQIKAENEKMVLQQQQIREEREFKANRRRDWLTFSGKALMLGLIVGVNLLMHKDELRFEREENGITPRRCGTYDSVVSKASEIVMR